MKRWKYLLLGFVAALGMASASSAGILDTGDPWYLGKGAPFWFHRVQGETYITPDGGMANQGPEVTTALYDCQFNNPTLRCKVRLTTGDFWVDQITMEQWGGTLMGEGTSRTVIHQFLNGQNTDAIRFKFTGSGPDFSQHWGGIENLQVRKGKSGDPFTTDTVGSGINFCSGIQGETFRVRDVQVLSFPEHGIRYGCPAEFYGAGDPPPVLGPNYGGGYVPGYVVNASLMGNGISGLAVTRNRASPSEADFHHISGDNNGRNAPGEGSLIWIDGGCGGNDSVCGDQITVIGVKSECATYQNYAVRFTQNIGQGAFIAGVSHKCGSGSVPTGIRAPFRVSDDTPLASPYHGARFKAEGVSTLNVGYTVYDDSRETLQTLPVHGSNDFVDWDPWKTDANYDYCSVWPPGTVHVAGSQTNTPGSICTCYQGDSRMIDNTSATCVNIP